MEGEDLLGIAQTGTGKTAAFALPILQLLLDSGKFRAPKTCRALILLPTRELAIQVEECFKQYAQFTAISTACIFGGVSDVSQKRNLIRGVDVLVATPGRLLDLINQKAVSLKALEFFVLDEADRMLDMGFIHDIRKVVALLQASPDIAQVWLVGQEFATACKDSSPQVGDGRFRHFADVEEVKAALSGHCPEHKLILIKGSNSIKLFQLPEML